MAKDDLYAFHGVILKCDKGATVLPLLTTPKKHAVSKLQIATVTDNIPVVNIPSFGVCSITGTACMPVAPQWLKAHDGAQKVLGQAPLLFSSYCKCQAGGTIEIFPSVDEAMAALENDKESRVDGIPLLDGILGAALTSPIGPILDLFTDGGADVTQGVGRGFRQGLKGTWNGLVQMVSHPVETAKGLTKMVGIAVVGYGTQSPVGQMSTPDQRLKDFDLVFGTDLGPTHEAICDAIADGWDKKVVNGTTEERSEVVGEVYEGVLEAVVGTKGAGAAVKGVTSAGKFVLGADRMAEITAAIAKLQSAMKLEALAGKVKGIFKVGSRTRLVLREGETLGDFGERVIRSQLEKEGFDKFYKVQNKSGNGVDIVARNSETGAMKKIEVKTTQQERLWADGARKDIPLSKPQREMGGEDYTNDRLNRAAREDDGYTDGVSSKEAEEAQEALRQAKRQGKSIDVEKHDVYVDKDGNLLGTEKRNWLKP